MIDGNNADRKDRSRMNTLSNTRIKKKLTIEERRTRRRRRKQVKRCSEANLSIDRTSALVLSLSLDSFFGLLLLKINGIRRAYQRR